MDYKDNIKKMLEKANYRQLRLIYIYIKALLGLN